MYVPFPMEGVLAFLLPLSGSESLFFLLCSVLLKLLSSPRGILTIIKMVGIIPRVLQLLESIGISVPEMHKVVLIRVVNILWLMADVWLILNFLAQEGAKF